MRYGLVKKSGLLLCWGALITNCAAQETGVNTDAKLNGVEIAAKVNGVNISVQQVIQVLKHLPNQEETQPSTVSLQVLRTLMALEVLAQKAVAEQLDRDTSVATLLEIARREILAEAYIDRKLGMQVNPTETEIAAYFDQHPDLFAKRKVYRLQEISIKAPKEKHEAIRIQLVASKRLNDFVSWLERRKFVVDIVQGTKSAEQLPMELLPKLAKFPEGRSIIFDAPGGLLVVVLAGIQVQPVTLDQSRSAISRVLQAQAKKMAVKVELEMLMSSAKFEYFGEYADYSKQEALWSSPLGSVDNLIGMQKLRGRVLH